MALKNVQLEYPRNGYRRLMPFNRFYVEQVDSIIIIHFGLLSASGLLLDRYSAGITQLELNGQKASLLEYLGRLGSIGEAPPPLAAASRVKSYRIVQSYYGEQQSRSCGVGVE